ncbi:hypothetical protein ABIA40_000451 [Bradyrhizobium sp. USDA 223]
MRIALLMSGNQDKAETAQTLEPARLALAVHKKRLEPAFKKLFPKSTGP